MAKPAPILVVNNSVDSIPLLQLTRRKPLLGSALRSKVFERRSNSQYHVSACSLQGFRHDMEDRGVIHLKLPQHPNIALFAVFDGHTGCKAAQYLAKNLHLAIDKLVDVSDNKAVIKAVVDLDKKFCKGRFGDNGSTIVFSLVEAIPIAQLDEETPPELPRQSSVSSISSDKTVLTDVEDSPSHTYQIRVFWAGDSRCLIGQFSEDRPTATTVEEFIKKISDETESTTSPRGKERRPNIGEDIVADGYRFKCATRDHLPDDEVEKARIVAANEWIRGGRVHGALAVSRAFGDSRFKESSAGSSSAVTCVCQVSEFEATTGDWMLLFSDGLVEMMDDESVVRALNNEIRACRRGMFHGGIQDSAYALGNLFETALERGSTDNMTAVFVQFDDGDDYGDRFGHSTYLPGPLYANRHDPVFMQTYMRHAERFGHRDDDELRRAAYKAELRLLKSGGSCHNLMKRFAADNRRVLDEQRQERYVRELEAQLDLLTNGTDPNGLPPHVRHGSGSTEAYSDDSDEEDTDVIMEGSPTPPLSSEEGDDEESVGERKSDLVRRVTDLSSLGGLGSGFEFEKRSAPLDPTVRSRSTSPVRAPMGRKRRLEDPGESFLSDGESEKPFKKRRIEMTHRKWLERQGTKLLG